MNRKHQRRRAGRRWSEAVNILLLWSTPSASRLRNESDPIDKEIPNWGLDLKRCLLPKHSPSHFGSGLIYRPPERLAFLHRRSPCGWDETVNDWRQFRCECMRRMLTKVERLIRVQRKCRRTRGLWKHLCCLTITHFCQIRSTSWICWNGTAGISISNSSNKPDKGSRTFPRRLILYHYQMYYF